MITRDIPASLGAKTCTRVLVVGESRPGKRPWVLDRRSWAAMRTLFDETMGPA